MFAICLSQNKNSTKTIRKNYIRVQYFDLNDFKKKIGKYKFNDLKFINNLN